MAGRSLTRLRPDLQRTYVDFRLVTSTDRGKKPAVTVAKGVMRKRSTQHGSRTPASAGLAGWRETRLRQAGFDAARASELARDGRIDFHLLLELVDRGCPADLAERIVAPLDGDGMSP